MSVPTFRRWIRTGDLPAVATPGGHQRITVADFQRFLHHKGMRPLPSGAAEPGVLVVDDEPPIVDAIVEYLAQHPRGFKVETATEGYEALIKVGIFRPAVLILDVRMPRLDGIEVCRRLRHMSETRDVQVLGITGYPDLVPALLRAGAAACLVKPLDFEELGAEVERLLQRVSASPRS